MQTRSKGQEPLPYEDEIDRRFRKVRQFCKETLISVKMAEEEQKALRDYAMPLVTEIQSSIQRPAIQATTFEIKPGTIQMIQNTVQFGGLPNDDPSEHLGSFMEICDTFRYHGVTEDAIRLRLFPFTLRDKAKRWLHSLPQGSITTWEDLAQKFLAKFFPPAKTSKMRNDITSFSQFDAESLYESWERFKDLLRKCPHHGIPKWLLVQTFYNGLASATRTSIDAAAGGALMGKNYDEAYKILETMAANNYQWPVTRANQPRAAGIHEVDAITALAAQVASLSKKIDTMGVQPMQSVAMVCELCAGNHASDQCAINAESVQYVGNYNRQQQQQNNSNSYNPGWRNHPNFSWRDNQAQNSAPRQQYPPGYQNQAPPQPEKKSNLEELLSKHIERSEFRINSQEVAIRNLENQMGQIANALNNRPHGALPSDTEVNPKREGKEHCKAVTLRTGKELTEVATNKSPKQTPVEEDQTEREESKTDKGEKIAKSQESCVQNEGGKQSSNVPPIPFPQRFQKREERRKAVTSD